MVFVTFKLPILASNLIKPVFSIQPPATDSGRTCSSRQEALGTHGCPSWWACPLPRWAPGWCIKFCYMRLTWFWHSSSKEPLTPSLAANVGSTSESGTTTATKDDYGEEMRPVRIIIQRFVSQWLMKAGSYL